MSTFIEIPASNKSIGQRKLINGIGVNDSPYTVTTYLDGIQTICPVYQTWRSMLERCYDPKYQIKKPTYIGCSVCVEWLSFMNFRAWMTTQDYAGKTLDKDLLITGNRVYRPEACIFLSNTINSLLANTGYSNKGCPIGVSWRKKPQKFLARCNTHRGNKSLGYYDTAEEAHQVYREFKSNYIREIADTQPEPIRSGLYRHADLI